MLDLKQIRENPTDVQAALARRGDYDLNRLQELDQQQRKLGTERSELQARSNEIGKKVGQAIKSGADPKGSEVAALKEEGNQIKAQISGARTQRAGAEG